MDILENIDSKIDLLQEQLENFERSGFFTEKEIDTLTRPIVSELERLTELNINSSK